MSSSGPSSSDKRAAPRSDAPMGPGSAGASSGGKAPSRAAGRSLKGRALQWLSQREHSRSELRRKLMPHARAEDLSRVVSDSPAGVGTSSARDQHVGSDPASTRDDDAAPDAAARVEAVLDWLEAHRYLSNERFIESRVHARSERYGNLRIRQELKQHQLALTPEAAQQLRDTERDRAEAVRLRKFGDLPATPVERARQARFLAARGFSPEVIGRVLRGRGGRPDEVD